jgi:TonB family protein
MKIVCDACGTKYSIDDSRVSGKTFKIRCKKCSGVINVRGAAAPVAEPAIEPVPDAGAWHVVLGGAQVGPLALEELRRLRTTGKINEEALIWREGFDDWRALGTVDEVRDVAPAAVVLVSASTVVAPEATVAPDGALAPAPTPARPALVSERKETSVLFTLRNLAELAAPTPATATASASPATGGEGSGLLDIRALARSMTPARPRAERGSTDDLPAYPPVAFVEPAVLVPGAPRGQDRRLVWALAGSLGVLAIVATALTLIVMHDGATAHAMPAPPPASASAAPVALAPTPPTPSPEVMRAAPTTATASAAQAAPAAVTPAIAQAAPAVATASAAPAAPAAAMPRTAPTASAAAMPRTAPTASAAATSASGTSASAPRRTLARTAPVPPTPPHPVPVTPPQLQPRRTAESCTEVSCVVSGYADKCCEIYREHAGGEAAPAPVSSQLPDSLDRPALAAGIARIDTSGCKDQSPAHGDVTVSIKVSPAGAVTAVTVKSSPAPELGACVTAAARKATFARTQRGGSFAYVWRF